MHIRVKRQFFFYLDILEVFFGTCILYVMPSKSGLEKLHAAAADEKHIKKKKSFMSHLLVIVEWQIKDFYSSEHKMEELLACLLLLVPPFKIHSNLHKLFYWDFIQNSIKSWGGKYIFLIAAVVVVVWCCCVKCSYSNFVHTIHTWSEIESERVSEYKRQEISWRKERNEMLILFTNGAKNL